jgi:hypothetical protein
METWVSVVVWSPVWINESVVVWSPVWINVSVFV